MDGRKNEICKLFLFMQHRKYCLWISITRNRAQALVSPLPMSVFVYRKLVVLTFKHSKNSFMPL